MQCGKRSFDVHRVCVGPVPPAALVHLSRAQEETTGSAGCRTMVGVKCITLAAGTNPEQAIYGDGLYRSEYPIGWCYLPPFEKIQVCWIC